MVMASTMKKMSWPWVIGVLVIAAAFVPFIPVRIVPEWTCRVVDKSGQPFRNITVEQYWQQFAYSFAFDRENTALTDTDSDGLVTFPERSMRISTARFLAGHASRILGLANPSAGLDQSAGMRCRGGVNCQKSYEPGEKSPVAVIAEK